jgi:hypothetical protein
MGRFRWDDWRPTASRFFKYAFLLIALSITVKIVFDGFSYYLARRSLDAELETKKISSLEYLTVITRQERALILASLETRCRERNQLAVIHVFNSELSHFSREAAAAYRAAFAVKDELVDHIERNGARIINVNDARDKINKFNFDLSTLESTLVRLQGVTDEQFNSFMRRPKELVEKYRQISEAHGELLRKVSVNPELLDLSHVQTLEDRLKRLKLLHDENKKKHGDWEEVLSKYAIWTEALAGRGQNPLLDEMAFDIKRDSEHPERLSELKCGNLEQYYSAVNGVRFNANAQLEEDNSGGVRKYYQEALFSYFSIPPVAQTLFVTLFLGALGALTLNVLRLSKVGWWSKHDDPLWGELTASPLLGALAAFGVFLLGSTGLLLTSDFRSAQTGVASISAFFIGLLGFISGLLYDEAFGRVRRLGSQLFSDARTAVDSASSEDRSLAALLKTADAALAAELVLKFGIGSRIAAEPEFTLLVPSDQAMSRLTLQSWREISEPESRTSFEAWFRKHHAVKRVTSNDVLGSSAGGSIAEIQVEDGTKYSLHVEDQQFTIGKIKVLKRDLEWHNGAIHILEEELA